jgi:hypothetical protein
MSRRLSGLVAGLVVTAFSIFGLLVPAQAQDGSWRVAKVSGEAWVSADGVQQASVSRRGDLRPGDSVRTGRNGRVLLVRGAESILIAPNSAISLPETGRPGVSSVIQQAGSILLDVEKRNVQHFEVETPYLAAVVKGTRFRVSLEGGRARVDVVRGQVQVADFRSGQFALVLPGQSARASFGQTTGLRLSGRGAPSPIEQGAPRAPRVAPIAVPRGGLTAPSGAAALQREAARGVAPVQDAAPAASRNEASNQRASGAAGIGRAVDGRLRISAPLGEVKLDIHKVTGGMARSDAQASGSSGGHRATVWSTGELNPGSRSGKATAGNSGNPAGTAETRLGAAAAIASASNSGSSAGRGNGNGVGRAASATIVSRGNGNGGGNADVGSGNNGVNTVANSNSGNGNGNSGNGNGNSGNGNSGNGNGNSGNGNSGNGNGSSGNGNSGNGNGNSGNGNSGNGNGNSGTGNNGNGNGDSGDGDDDGDGDGED